MDQIIHIVRGSPPWSTCEPITICGNKVAEHDKSLAAMEEYIKTKCRGSKKVAYGTCCVSCLSNMSPWFSSRTMVSAEANILVEYLTKFGRHSGDRKDRIAAEISALNKILIDIDFNSTVEKEIEQREWRGKLKSSNSKYKK